MPKKDTLQTLLLYAAEAGVLVLALSLSPSSSRILARKVTRLINSYSGREHNPYSEESVRKSLYIMKKKGYLDEIKKGKRGILQIELTRKGRVALGKEGLKVSPIKTPAQWDGHWRFVMFDIPEKSRWARDGLREKLRKLHFLQIQQSVWVHPYPCEKEIELVVELFHIKDYLLLFEGTIHNDKKLRIYFRKQGLLL